jgi:hypothetical protein
MDRIKDRFIREELKIINDSNKNIVFYYNDVLWRRKRIWISPSVGGVVGVMTLARIRGDNEPSFVDGLRLSVAGSNASDSGLSLVDGF